LPFISGNVLNDFPEFEPAINAPEIMVIIINIIVKKINISILFLGKNLIEKLFKEFKVSQKRIHNIITAFVR
jgi:hypothetical protein